MKHTILNPLQLNWLGCYNVNKPAQTSQELVSLEVAKTLCDHLTACVNRLEELNEPTDEAAAAIIEALGKVPTF